MAATFTFLCPQCGKLLEAALGDVGSSRECDRCGVANVVPRPKLRLGGVDLYKDKQSFPQRPARRPDPPPQPQVAPEIAERIDSAVPVSRGKGLLKLRDGLIVTGFAALGGTLYWTDAVPIGARAAARWASNIRAPVRESRADDADSALYQGIFEDIVSSAITARAAREAIVTDLSVSLAEMESRNMTEQAKIVRAAIARKEEAVALARDQAGKAITLLSDRLPRARKDWDRALLGFKDSSPLGSEPANQELLGEIADVASRLPAERASFIEKAMTIWKRAVG